MDFSALYDEATGHRRNAGIRAGGHLRGHLEFAKHFPGALASTQGALWKGKRAAESLGNGAPSARQIVCIFAMDSEQKCLVHYKYAAILAVEFHPVKMQAIWPAALVGAPSGHPRTTSKQKTAFQKSLSTSNAFFFELFCPQRRGHETL